jgi:outer membrane receptor protein involved in Fe transport
MTAPNFGAGWSEQGNQGAPGFGFGASTASCTSGLNFFNPPAGGFSQDCLEAISADLKNRSKVSQTIWEANATGSLFELPAGPLQAAVGASYRKMGYSFLNDTLTTQGRSFQDQALGIYPSGNSFGSINVKEVYGELSVPILKDTFIKDLSLELGGRISDYSTTGTSYTYKALADLAITDWLRFRGGYNRAERAPNIAELFLAPQQTFAGNTAGDPCSTANPLTFSANPTTNPTNAAAVQAVCKVLMDQTGNVNAKDQYYNNPQSNSTFSFAFPTLLGNANLKPEKADTWTAGVVLSSPFATPALSRLRLSVDYYNIKVKDAIGPQSIAIALQQCFDVALNPAIAGSTYTGTGAQGTANAQALAAANNPFCQNVPRNADQGVLGNVTTTYVNNGRFMTDGIDAQLDWGLDVGPGTLSTNVVFNYLLHFKSSGLPTNPMVDYAGTLGTVDNGLNGAAYRWKLLANLGYKVGPASIGLQWQHLPSIEDSSEPLFAGGTPTTGYPAYDLFELSGSYDLTDNFTIRAGVENLFDKNPPLGGINTANTDPATTGLLSGGSYNATYYDTLGRRFYIGANMKF